MKIYGFVCTLCVFVFHLQNYNNGATGHRVDDANIRIENPEDIPLMTKMVKELIRRTEDLDLDKMNDGSSGKIKDDADKLNKGSSGKIKQGKLDPAPIIVNPAPVIIKPDPEPVYPVDPIDPEPVYPVKPIRPHPRPRPYPKRPPPYYGPGPYGPGPGGPYGRGPGGPYRPLPPYY